METSGVSATTSAGSFFGAAGQSQETGLGEDAFMQLLLAQLQNQDPLNPMEDMDFIAQLAQFNSLSQLAKMSQSLEDLLQAQSLGQGSALIGKSVTGLSSSGELISGVVSGLQMVGGAVTLDLDGQRMPLSDVQSVTQTDEE